MASKAVYDINIEQIQDSVAWSNIVDSMEYIQLETKDDCLLGEIDQMMVHNGNIYVLSEMNLHCFDPTGKHLFSLQKGNARNEINEIRSANIANDRLCVYDYNKHKVLFFDLQDGHFLQSVDVSGGFGACYSYDDKWIKEFPFYNMNEKDGRFWICSEDHEPLQKLVFDRGDLTPIRGQITVREDGLVFSSRFHNNAYKITTTGIIPYINVNVPAQYQLSEEKIAQAVATHSISIPDDNESIYGMSSVSESESFITFYFSKSHLRIIYDKQTEKFLCFHNVVGMEDWQYFPSFIQATEGDYLYNSWNADFVNMIKRMSPDSTTFQVPAELQQAFDVYRANTASDNPIVVKFKLKHIH